MKRAILSKSFYMQIGLTWSCMLLALSCTFFERSKKRVSLFVKAYFDRLGWLFKNIYLPHPTPKTNQGRFYRFGLQKRAAWFVYIFFWPWPEIVSPFRRNTFRNF
jgi:hypothetical protein